MKFGTGFADKIRQGLTKSSKNLLSGLSASFGGGGRDAASWDALEDALIQADFGPNFAHHLVQSVKSDTKSHDFDAIRAILAEKIEKILHPLAQPLTLDPAHHPQIILITGVNGSGKTTSIGKLAHFYRQSGLKIMLVAADRFRAAAIGQLQIWAERADVTCVAGTDATDPAALVYQALDQAKAENFDLVLIDTAGRLGNNQGLMDELGKIVRVIKKHDATAPHHSLLVIDATIGQNAMRQVEQFQSHSALTGFIVTKLDGTAKAGILVALAERFGLAFHAIGVGEGIDDLRPFNARDFARHLLDLP